MNELFSQLNSLVQNNQILSTVAGGSVIVWLVTNIKSIFSKIVDGITALISFTIFNTYEDTRNSSSGWMSDSQKFFNRFLSSTKMLWERTQNLDLSAPNTIRYNLDGSLMKGSETNVDSLTYGFSIRIIFGKVVFVHRSIERSQKITVSTSLRVFFASKNKFMKKLKDSIEDCLKADALSASERKYIHIYNGEVACGDKCKRSMDSIFTNHGEHYELLNSIRDFIDNEDKYRKLSYPYTYSALLYGEPGCGKTSTILAIASALCRDIMYINLGKITLKTLVDNLNVCPRCRIIVFEDIDALTTAVGETREESAKDHRTDGADDIRSFCSSLVGISLSDLLNITDGLLASDGTVCLFTTNHIERLDPAFLRSGRMNKLVEFRKLNRSTAARMIKENLGYNILPECFKDDEINPADLQAAILNVALGRETWENLSERFLVQ